MRLLKLSLTNFQGVKSFTLSLKEGESTYICGDNATGKTTLFNSICWLLFDKGGDFKSINVKTLDDNGDVVHGLEHSVEATFEIDNGEITLSKTFCEKWTKKRGSKSKLLTGHETKYLVDGVPNKMSEYKKITTLLSGGEDMFKLLTSPMYFSATMPWKDRRQIVLESCDGANIFDEVIHSTESLSELPKLLGKHSVDDYRKIVTAKRKKINSELTEIPVRIDEIYRGMPVLPKKTMAELEEEKASLSSPKLDTAEDTARKKILTEMNSLLEENRQLEAAHFASCQKELNTIQSEQWQCKERINALNTSIEQRKSIDGMISELNAKMHKLRVQYRDIKSKIFAYPEESEVCPTCGQQISAKLQEERFERLKVTRLNNINLDGTKLKKEVEGLIERSKALEEAETPREELDRELKELEERQSAVEKHRAESLPVEVNKNNAKIEALREAISNRPSSVKPVDPETEARLQEIAAEISALSQREQSEKRISELKSEEETLGTAFEQCEYELGLLEDFTRAQVAALETRAAKAFPGVGFKMFKELINGGVEECCEVMSDGVPFNGGLNHAAQINTGIKIINALSSHYGVSLPIWVDNAEAVNEIENTDSQIINLVVSKDKQLTVKEVR